MAAPAFFIKVRAYTFRDGTFGPRLDLRIDHGHKVETLPIPIADDEVQQNELAALERGKALAADFMQSRYPRQGYNLEE